MVFVFDKNFKNYDERFLCKRVKNEGGRYQDTETWYEIESTMPEEDVKEYCKTKLHYCPRTKNEREYYLEKYYEFKKIDNNKYSYYVCEPYCD